MIPDIPARQEEDASWQEATRLRREHRGWIVVWLAPKKCFRAYRRLAGARRDTALSAATSGEMATLIGQAEHAATARRGAGGCGTGSQQTEVSAEPGNIEFNNLGRDLEALDTRFCIQLTMRRR